MMYPNGQPMSLLQGTDSRNNEIRDIKQAYARIASLNPGFEAPPIPSPEYVSLPVSNKSSSSSSGGCYVATAVYGSYDCPEVWTLRRYRDDTLAETWYGRAFIHTYYAISPTLVKYFGDSAWFKNMWKPKLDRMVRRLNGDGVENTPYEDKPW